MKRQNIVRGLGAFLLFTGLWVGLSQQPPVELTVTKVADDLHVIVGSGGNVAVYTTSEGAILVDDKFEQNVPQIMAKVASLTDKPVRYVLNTHQHGDHTGGNAKIMAQGADIIAHENARTNMEKGNMPGLPRVTFQETMSVHLGGKQVKAYHLGRGHTNGDAVMYFPALKTIHTGDLFVAGRPFIDYSSGGSGVAWVETLERALKLDFETVIPGHGPVMKKADLAEWRKSFATLQGRIKELNRQGKSQQEAGGLLKFDDLANWGAASRLWDRSYEGLWGELTK